jgi:hypothetical protein
MAKRLAVPSKELQLHILGPRDLFRATRVQRLSVTTDIPSDTKDELGNPLHVGDVKDIPNITVTFSAFDVGIKIFSALTGQNAIAYPAAGVDISALGEMDAIAYVKDPDVADYVKSMHARRLQIRDFTFSYSADGDATEDYTAVGSEKRWLRYDVQVDKFTTGTTSFTLTQTPIQLKNGKWALSVVLDGKYLEETSSAPATGEYRIVGVTLTTGDTRTAQCLVSYHANPAGSNWASIADAQMPAAVKGKDIPITIAANSIPRVQSITINGSLNTQPVKEMGNKNIVGYQRQVPTVEGTITVLDTDYDLVSLFSYGVMGSGIEWTPGEGCTTSGVSLKIEILDPCDTTIPYTVLKTVYIPTITIVGDSFTSNVNENASQTFNWKSTDAQCIIYSGAKP